MKRRTSEAGRRQNSLGDIERDIKKRMEDGRTMTLKQALAMGKDVLRAAGIADASLDAWLLLEFITGISRAKYYMEPDKILTQEEILRYEEVLKERSGRKPLQHITGEQAFMGFDFRVNEYVLVPRQDTELLVECALEKAKTFPVKRALDMCTGSGCIILSLVKLAEKAGRAISGEAADISTEALAVAEENAARLEAACRFIESDLFAAVEGKYDMIVSNPPYIRTEEIQKLEAEVRLHDPYIALDGKEDGLYFYRRIIAEGRAYLTKGGWLLLEIGHDQREEVTALMEAAGYCQITSKKDLAGLDRVVMGMYNIA